MIFRRSLLLAALTGLLLGTGLTQAQTVPTTSTEDGNDTRTSWQVDTILVRAATLGIAVRLPPASVPLRHIVLALSTSVTPTLTVATGNTNINVGTPWLRAAAKLNMQGIGVAFADVPSDANKRALYQRPDDIVSDAKQALNYLAKKYPDVPLHLGLFSTNAPVVLDALNKFDAAQKVVAISGAYLNSRTADWYSVKHPVMFIDAPSAQCDTSPFHESEYIARKNGFTLVKAGYQLQEQRLSCDQQTRLTSLDTAFAELVEKWFSNAPIPEHIGFANPQTRWREQVLNYLVNSKKQEMTLLLPDGPGPFPIMVYNHGDIFFDSDYVRYKRRYREMIVAREFLRYGVAVAMPSRPGIGMSEGIYMIPSNSSDADASYKGRLHAQSVMPAIELLKTIPELDANRIIITGQSAGGYSTMYMASQNLPGVIGAVNFSGGRTDAGSSQGRGYLNRTMVSGFEEAGKTAHIPVLMIFAENDSRYSANTIRNAYQAFVDAGGKATLSLSPPISIDGHFIFHQPELWRAVLRTYLEEIGIVQKEVKPTPHAAVGN